MIDRADFKNHNNVIHNNLNHNLQDERIVEYFIDIDSNDRNTSSFLDPFSYVVTFAPITNSGMSRHEEWIDPRDHSKGQKIVEEVFNGAPEPHIRRHFKNVKYIRVDSVSLPKYAGIVYDSGSGSWILDSSKNLSLDRFVTLKISNLESQRIMSTNSIVDGNGVKLIPDTLPLTSNYYMTIPSNSSNMIKVFNDNSLGNIDRLNISFYDSFGTQLRYTNLDTSQVITDVRNPKNKYLQHNITLILGIMENELSTEVSYGSH
jgi:hypothetical protein